MNIIYMHTHDTGRYIEPYGYNVSTPNLMNLAKEGTLFRHAFCAGPTCSPSRAALLTGMAPHSTGMYGLAHRGFSMEDYNKHLANFLQGHGYETVLCGVQHETEENKKHMLGYQRVLEEEKGKASLKEYSGHEEEDLDNAQIAAKYLRSRKSSPFFLSFGMKSTHREFPSIAEDINPDFVMPPFPMYDTRKNREDMAAFMTSARVADNCIGIILKALKETGLEKETIVVFTTDHGIAFPKMKCTLYDTGIGVSLIMSVPGNLRKGEAVDSIVSHVDIFPTLCDLLGIQIPEWVQGKSMLPLLNKSVESIREEIFSEVTFHAAYEPMRCVRTERYKLIKYFDEYPKQIPANIDDGLSKDFVMTNGFMGEAREKELLFDLYMDPCERINLVNHDSYGDIYYDLSLRLKNWMRSTGDPLLQGNIEKPAGAKVNVKDALSPKERVYEA